MEATPDTTSSHPAQRHDCVGVSYFNAWMRTHGVAPVRGHCGCWQLLSALPALAGSLFQLALRTFDRRRASASARCGKKPMTALLCSISRPIPGFLSLGSCCHIQRSKYLLARGPKSSNALLPRPLSSRCACAGAGPVYVRASAFHFGLSCLASSCLCICKAIWLDPAALYYSAGPSLSPATSWSLRKLAVLLACLQHWCVGYSSYCASGSSPLPHCEGLEVGSRHNCIVLAGFCLRSHLWPG
jgi:hypothetical protein